MTLLDKLTYLIKSGLAILLVPIFFACDDPTELGLELDGEDNNLDTKKVEFTLPASTIAIDSLRTDQFNVTVVGQYSDSTFGSSRATAYNRYNLNAGTLPGDSLDFSSAFIRMKVFDTRADANLAEETISVHEAQDSLYSSAVYFADKSLPYDPEPIGTNTFSFDIERDSVIEIPLSEAFGNFLYNRLKQTDSLTDGSYYYNPLVFVPGEDNEGLLAFDLTDDTTAIYIQMTNSAGQLKYYTFDFRDKRFTHIDRDRSGSKLSDLTTEYTPSSNAAGRSYMDMINGVYTKLDLSPLIDFVEQSKNTLVNKAILSYEPVVPPSEYIENLSPLNHFFIKTNGRINGPAGNSEAAANYALVTEGSYLSGNAALLSTVLEETDYHYQAQITLFSQILFDSFINQEDYLTRELVLLSQRTLSLGQTRINNAEFKLTLYYTTIKE